MDKFEQLSEAASYAVAIFGNPARGDYALYDLTKGTPYPVAGNQREIAEGAFVFCGVMGIVRGVPRTALALELDPWAYTALSQAFCERIEAAVTKVEGTLALTTAPGDDSEEWLFRLYNLKDPR